jgi:hypothetical protein
VQRAAAPPSPQTLRARFVADEISQEEFEAALEQSLQLPQYQETLWLQSPVISCKRCSSWLGPQRHGGLEVTPNRLTLRRGRSRQLTQQTEFAFDVDPALLRAMFARPNLDYTTRVEFDDYRTELSVTCLRRYPYLLRLYARQAIIGGPALALVWLRERELTKLIQEFANATLPAACSENNSQLLAS